MILHPMRQLPVGEDHPDSPFLGDRACDCGGAGAPCPVCNQVDPADPDDMPEMPDDFIPDDAKRKMRYAAQEMTERRAGPLETRSLEEYERQTADHERAIGKIVIAWNQYQETLGTLFANLFSHSDWPLALSAWHALDSDRSQRKMLVAAARAKLKPNNPLLTEFEWLINNSDKIADQRNIGIHMPLMRASERDGSTRVLPHAIFGNPKAARMNGRDLLKEYAHFERQIRKMFSYAVALDFALTPEHKRRDKASLPERPKLTPFSPSAS
ncbi:hypothetical protein [Bradyrhizobium australiense]|uniref:Uncharacterized protein n=1 Tax=Bradyrhizobium australiense TaxID=2721161 RepID=A0A7Y4GX77_9BRAD|nr:hypothetical protein [Bradyrhizobium australiense]NOJ43032.1 hypothetical protein [Bradyrhizobium australiense]